ncbi:hypothetical protein ElyMa_000331600 [Elysia marginata]|uniref:Uncharacterized protein n=1 Tax=Elysia marginata TaxID=1093978 RepID=A0AAV4FBC5_9GAST|nr:hypothetical protein ElyMa_000331600 [Elysia marginata]
MIGHLLEPVRFEQLIGQPEVRYLLLQSQLPALAQTNQAENPPPGVR